MFGYRTASRNGTLALLCALALGLAVPGHTPAAAHDDDEVRHGQIVVKLRPSARERIAEINNEHDTRVIDRLDENSAIYLLQTEDNDLAETLEELREDRRVIFAEPNYVGEAPEVDPRGIGAWGGTDPEPMYGQNALTQLGIEQAHALSKGAGTVVAVIDTGVQLDHPTLAASWAEEGYDFVDNDPAPADEQMNLDENGDGVTDAAYGHGTHVAGIIRLVAPEARILPLRAINADGFGDLFAVARAIDYAVDHGATVINLSLGTNIQSNLLRDAVRDASRRGVVVVAAAGNGNSTTPQHPAADQCAIAVTAVGADDLRSPFANYGPWISVAAPGESIYSAFPPSGFAWWSGTSMATPFVAGQAALIKSLSPDLAVNDVAAVIGGTARQIDASNPGYSGQLGDGRIDIAVSLVIAQAGFVPDAPHSHMSSSCLGG